MAAQPPVVQQLQTSIQYSQSPQLNNDEEKYPSASPPIASPIASPMDGITNGWYIIQNVKTGLVLDIAGGSNNKGAGAQIRLAEDNKTPSQTFFIQKSNDEYSFKNKGSGLFLQIKTGILTFKEGAELQQRPQNTNKSQQFTLINIEENVYHIQTNQDRYLDINGVGVQARVQQKSPNDKRAQKFRMIPVKTGKQIDDGWYSIENIASGLVFEVPKGSNKKGKPIQQSKANNMESQAFYIQKVNDKYYSIKNEGSGLYLAIFNQNDRSKLQQYPKLTDQDSRQDAQQFTFIETDKDIYYIQLKISEKYIDVQNGSKKAGVKLQQLTPKIKGTDSQKFRIVPAVDGRTKAKGGFLARMREKVMAFARKQLEDFKLQMKLLAPIMKGVGFKVSEIVLAVDMGERKIEIKCTISIGYQDGNWDELVPEQDKLNKMGKALFNGMRRIDKARRLFPLQLNSFTLGVEFKIKEPKKPSTKFELSFSPNLGHLKKAIFKKKG